MSDVPANTSMRPSGFTLIQACDGSPFWFIPVGYSIAANPRPVLTCHQWASGSASWPTRCSGRRSPVRWLAGHRLVLGLQLVADGVGDRLDRRHGRRVGVDDLVRRRVADPVRVLQPQLVRIDPELRRDPAQVRLGRERDRRDAEAAHRGRRRAVRVDDVAVELEVRDRVRARVVEAVLREAVRREPRVRARSRGASASCGRGSSRPSSPRPRSPCATAPASTSRGTPPPASSATSPACPTSARAARTSSRSPCRPCRRSRRRPCRRRP